MEPHGHHSMFCSFFFQGHHGDSVLMCPENPLVERRRRKRMTGCHLWTQKSGAGDGALRGSSAMEISSPGLAAKLNL